MAQTYTESLRNDESALDGRSTDGHSTTYSGPHPDGSDL